MANLLILLGFRNPLILRFRTPTLKSANFSESLRDSNFLGSIPHSVHCFKKESRCLMPRAPYPTFRYLFGIPLPYPTFRYLFGIPYLVNPRSDALIAQVKPHTTKVASVRRRIINQSNKKISKIFETSVTLLRLYSQKRIKQCKHKPHKRSHKPQNGGKHL